ncbi:hypothetical protein GCM10027566_09070 [Arachidicoccus ginsenosidivorans]
MSTELCRKIKEKNVMYNKTNWPDDQRPEISAIYALNDIDINAPVEVVWKLLVDAENWVNYFPPEDQVNILGDKKELELGIKWTRVTIGYLMYLTITEFEPYYRLAWKTTVDGDQTGSTAYHGWVITPTENGVHVLTEETQQGEWFVNLLGHKHPGGLYAYHQQWLERLKVAAEANVATE